MPWARHRLPLAAAAGLDAVGFILLAQLVNRAQGLNLSPLSMQTVRLPVVLLLIYWSFAWLFGSYTLLKMPRVSWMQAVARIGSSVIASISASALISYVFRLQISNSLFFRSNLIPLFVFVGLWSGLVRLFLRNRWPQNERPRWQIMALREEVPSVRSEWTTGTAFTACPRISDLDKVRGKINDSHGIEPLELGKSEGLALSTGVINDPALQQLFLEAVDQGHPINSLVEIAEQELQRIPARWVGNQWLLFSSRIDGGRSTLQKQLKRYADVVLSMLLLLICSPILLLSALLVKLQDGGPILYRQQRSGLLGQPFEVLKIRTMTTCAESAGAQWAQENDRRITAVGQWLRRTRLDELPQLINVLRGEMSLIGPRPERPELERNLEQEIPNYRLRHWVRPGLSGWAQVNMPYASSFQDAELKLSYDLFYLRNASLWLDLLILFKTIKVVLKAAGR